MFGGDIELAAACMAFERMMRDIKSFNDRNTSLVAMCCASIKLSIGISFVRSLIGGARRGLSNLARTAFPQQLRLHRPDLTIPSSGTYCRLCGQHLRPIHTRGSLRTPPEAQGR
jgi:hypothetical protein